MVLHNPEPGTDFTDTAAACLDPNLATRRRQARLRKMVDAQIFGKVPKFNADGHGLRLVRAAIGEEPEIAAFPFGAVREMAKKEGGQKLILDTYVARNKIYRKRWCNDPRWKYIVTNGMIFRADKGGFNAELGRHMDQRYIIGGSSLVEIKRERSEKKGWVADDGSGSGSANNSDDDSDRNTVAGPSGTS